MPQPPATPRLARDSLIQFGAFVQGDGDVWPLALHLRWLPSYPALLRDAALAVDPLIAAFPADRVLTTVDGMPLGMALAALAGRRVVYPYGAARDLPPAYAIEGAYDVGHPTVLLADVLLDAPQAESIRALAGRVGLEIVAVVAVVDLGLGAREALQAAGLRAASVFELRAALALYEDAGLLTPAMRRTVEAWLDARRAAASRPL